MKMTIELDSISADNFRAQLLSYASCDNPDRAAVAVIKMASASNGEDAALTACRVLLQILGPNVQKVRVFRSSDGRDAGYQTGAAQ